LSIEEKDYKESSLIEIKIIPFESEYHVEIMIDIEFGEFAAIEFSCTNISCDLYKYKGMSYQNVYYDSQYQLSIQKMRSAYKKHNFLETEYKDLGDGYIVKANSYGTKGCGENNVAYERVFIQKCYLMYQNKTIFEYESIYRMPRITAEIIHHQNGQKYFLFKSDLYGLNVYNMEDKSVFYYIPEGLWHHYQYVLGESFIITDIHYDSETNKIAYEGCYWGGTNDVMVGDFTEPMNFAPELVSMHEIVDPEYELYDDIDFSRWENGELYLWADRKIEKKIDEKLSHDIDLAQQEYVLREKIRVIKEELEEILEEKKEEKTREGTGEKIDAGSASNKAEQLLNEKMEASKDGIIYLNDTDIRTIIEAAQKENAGKTAVKDQEWIGANLDLKI